MNSPRRWRSRIKSAAEGQSAGFIGAVVGAILVLFVYHMLRGRRPVV